MNQNLDRFSYVEETLNVKAENKKVKWSSFSYRHDCFFCTHGAVEASQKIRLQPSGTHWTHPQVFFNSKFVSAQEICSISFLLLLEQVNTHVGA